MKTKILLLILYLIVSCNSIETNKNDNQLRKFNFEKLAQIANEKYKKDYNIKYNTNGDYALCIHKRKSNIPGPASVDFFIYDLSKDKITYEGNIPMGIVSWESEYEIKIEEIPGTVQKNINQTYFYLLNVKTNLKTKMDG